MDAAKFLDLYEKAVNKAMQQTVGTIGEYGVHMADLRCIGRMRAALAGGAEGGDGERLGWQPITAPGQVKVGDKLRFNIGSENFNERVKRVINKGYDDEELIYNIRKNFYLITSMAIGNRGSAKNIEFQRASTGKDGEQGVAK